MTKPSTSKVYVNDISEDGVLQEIQTGLEFIEFTSRADSNVSVFNKPNLTDHSHKSGILIFSRSALRDQLKWSYEVNST